MTSTTNLMCRMVVFVLTLWVMAPEIAKAQDIVYYHTDVLGTPVAMTNSSGNVIERREFEPYGRQLVPGTVADGPGFTGHVSDAATGFAYMQQRYYDPQLGRFLSVDPMTVYSNPAGAFNRYWYANNNPYRFTDPDGRCSVEERSGCHEGVDQSLVAKIGRLVGSLAGNPIAGFRPDRTNPFTGKTLTRGEAFDARLSALVLLAPMARIETASAKGATTLYRSVSASERADIAASGVLRAGPNSFSTGKWFWESAEHAVQFGSKMDGPGNFHIIEATFPRSAAERFIRLDRLDGIGPARFGTWEQLGAPSLRLRSLSP